MYSSENESQKNTDQSAAKPFAQQKKNAEPIDHLSANRFKQAAQLQEIADRYTLGQRKPSGQAASSNVSEIADGVVQREVDVYMAINTDTKKKIVANGKVEEFSDGSDAGSTGWLGVDKYRARFTVEDEDTEIKDSVGPLQNSFTNPEAGHVLAKRNGGNGGDPENIFAQDGGTNNGIYKAFEGRMRNALNQYEDEDDVEFVAYLVGEDITSGNIADAGLDDASDISSEEDEEMNDSSSD